MLKRLAPGKQDYEANYSIRGEIGRVAGFDGNAVQSGYRLSFLLPLLIWYMNVVKNSFLRYIPILIGISALLLLMTRGAIVGSIASCLFLFYFLIKVRKSILIKLISATRILLTSSMVLVILYVSFPQSNKIITNYFAYNYSKKNEKDMEDRLYWIEDALQKAMEKPLLGYGSPQYAYNKVMNTLDVPAPLIYLLSGGILLLIIFMIWIYLMPAYMIKFSKSHFLKMKDNIIYIYLGAAFVGGIVPFFSNWQEQHVLVMIMLFSAAYKNYINYSLRNSSVQVNHY